MGSITPQIQRSQVQPIKLRCRFEMTAADAPSSHEFCVFEFPGCEGCPKAQHTVRTVGSSEDPMKSEALRAWVAGASRPKKSFSLQSGWSAMEKYIHRENLNHPSFSRQNRRTADIVEAEAPQK